MERLLCAIGIATEEKGIGKVGNIIGKGEDGKRAFLDIGDGVVAGNKGIFIAIYPNGQRYLLSTINVE